MAQHSCIGYGNPDDCEACHPNEETPGPVFGLTPSEMTKALAEDEPPDPLVMAASLATLREAIDLDLKESNELRAKLDAAEREVERLREAATLKRNTTIDPEYHDWARKVFKGRWVAVPEEDFDRLRAALAPTKGRP